MLSINTFLNLADSKGYKKGKAGIIGYLFNKGLINASIYNHLKKYKKEEFFKILQDAINRYNALPPHQQIEQNFIIILSF
jgi:hypothetical protein